MEYLQSEQFDKWIKNIDKANHLIQLYFPENKHTLFGKSTVGFVNQVYRYQLVSVTYNNWACLYKQRNKLMNALKCLYQALKADKDLIRLFQKISEIRVNSKIDGSENYKELEELNMNDTNRNDFASTYLNICAILSLMGNHEKALHMAQKAIEMVTQENRNRYFVFEEFL